MPIHGYPGGVITANPTAPTISSASGVWTTEQQLINQSAGRWPMAQTQISRSLRFNSADSAYLNRTPASASNRKTWTWSGWVKRGALDSAQVLFGSRPSGSSNENAFISFNSSNAIYIFSRNPSDVVEFTAITNAVFRDPSAWYHVLFYLDTTQSTSTNRMALYVNGVQQTFSSSTYPTQNLDCYLNQNVIHFLGSSFGDNYLSGYLAEVNFIDGLALTPAYFGFNDSNTGVWTPRQYTGAYGTNGFYINFSDNSNTTAATLGKDYSGNGNNWTPNNFSVTAGAGNDSLVDSPTSYGTDTGVGGEVRGNYATLNPIEAPSASVISNGNLQVVVAATGTSQTPSTIGVTSGKWYSEFTFSATASGNAVAVGVGPANTYQPNIFNVGVTYNAFDGEKYVLGVNTPYGATWTTGDIIGIALDVDGGTITFYKNNSSQGAITLPASASGWKFGIQNGGGSSTKTMIANFGQRAFAYTAPSGFKALCTQNLPTPTIGANSTTQANDYFNVLLYTGNSTTPNATRAITGVGFQPDFVWIKNRSAAPSHLLQNAVLGANKLLFSDGNSSQQTDWAYGHLNSFDSDGFTVDSGSDSSVNTAISINRNNDTYVAWNWKANGAGGSNTAGTISSTVSANTTSGFSVVTYTGSSTGNDGTPGTVGHGLGVAPSFIMFKPLDTYDGCAYSSGLTSASYRLVLFSSSGNLAEASDNGFFNGTAPTSTVFSVGTRKHSNSNGGMVAYCFAPVAGYSAFGKYTGNGSSDGPFVYLGFRPAFLMLKRTDSTGNWMMKDFRRDGYNVVKPALFADLADAEYSDALNLDLISNGFKLRNAFANSNANTGTYIYMAFAEFPFKYSLAE